MRFFGFEEDESAVTKQERTKDIELLSREAYNYYREARIDRLEPWSALLRSEKEAWEMVVTGLEYQLELERIRAQCELEKARINAQRDVDLARLGARPSLWERLRETFKF